MRIITLCCIVLLQMAPSTILTSCKQDYQLQKTLESYGKQGYIICYYNIRHTAQPSLDGQDQPSIATIETLPSSDFGKSIKYLLHSRNNDCL